MLNGRRLWILLRQAAKEFSRDHCTHLAAGISYYAVFAIFPLLIFVSGITGLFLRDTNLQKDLISTILDAVPLDSGQGRSDLEDIVSGLGQPSSGVIGIAGLFLTAWTASSLFGAIRRSINLAYNVEAPRPFVRQKLLDLGMVLGLAPFFVGSIVLTGVAAFARTTLDDVPVIEILSPATSRVVTGDSWDFRRPLVRGLPHPVLDCSSRAAWSPGCLARSIGCHRALRRCQAGLLVLPGQLRELRRRAGNTWRRRRSAAVGQFKFEHHAFRRPGSLGISKGPRGPVRRSAKRRTPMAAARHGRSSSVICEELSRD